MIKAFIFDLDGVLQDSEILYIEAWKRVYQEKGYPVSHDEATKFVYGRAKDEVFANFHFRFPDAFGTIEEIQGPLDRCFFKLREKKDVRIHGSIHLLKKLSTGFPVCIVSGNGRRDVAEAVAYLGIEKYIRFFLGCEDYSPGKPDPSGFLLAASRLDVSPQHCLVFEDSGVGVQAAKQAGMACVALWRKKAPAQELSEADEVLGDLEQFNLDKWTNPLE